MRSLQEALAIMRLPDMNIWPIGFLNLTGREFLKLPKDCLVFEPILRYFYHVLAVEGRMLMTRASTRARLVRCEKYLT